MWLGAALYHMLLTAAAPWLLFNSHHLILCPTFNFLMFTSIFSSYPSMRSPVFSASPCFSIPSNTLASSHGFLISSCPCNLPDLISKSIKLFNNDQFPRALGSLMTRPCTVGQALGDQGDVLLVALVLLIHSISFINLCSGTGTTVPRADHQVSQFSGGIPFLSGQSG